MRIRPLQFIREIFRAIREILRADPITAMVVKEFPLWTAVGIVMGWLLIEALGLK
jgi:hypothetical protein